MWVCRTFYRKNLARLFYGLFCMPLGCLHVVACVKNIWMKLKRTPFFGRSIFSFPLTASEMSLKLSFVTKAYLRRVRSIFFIYLQQHWNKHWSTHFNWCHPNKPKQLTFVSLGYCYLSLVVDYNMSLFMGFSSTYTLHTIIYLSFRVPLQIKFNWNERKKTGRCEYFDFTWLVSGLGESPVTTLVQSYRNEKRCKLRDTYVNR